ncbi:hypothetical protein AB0395_12970 [Streptosporangium sp. NPDC051023]|uniref:DprA-like winged helix domain-containing protein n=1 Tax=Streptosporangium sp. NPDC051023 TaxID=3155410 RepID=UPI00344B3FFD
MRVLPFPVGKIVPAIPPEDNDFPDPTGMDELVHRTGLTTAELSSMLLVMELEGRVSAQHGRYFRNR